MAMLGKSRWIGAVGWVASQQHRISRGQGSRDYEPKTCRTGGCSLPFRHEGRCEGRNRQPLKVEIRPETGPGERRARNARRRSIGLADGGKLVRRSPRAAQVPGAREHMAEIRAHRNSQAGHRSAQQVRRDRALAKAAKGLGG